jgi:hypothetical protein
MSELPALKLTKAQIENLRWRLIVSNDVPAWAMDHTPMRSEKPNPGSDEAIAQGCKCPVIDNHHGKGVPMGKNGAPLFWVSEKCPMHGGPTHEQ